MLDLKLLRDNPDQIKAKLGKRKPEYIIQLDQVIALDRTKRALQKEVESYQSQRNTLSKSIKSADEAEKIKAEMQIINQKLSQLEVELTELEADLRDKLLRLPNLPANEAPLGRDESENKILKEWGVKPSLKDPKPHWEIAEAIGILDTENTTRLCGARFSSFVGAGARLARALVNFMLEEAITGGYQEMAVPALIRSEGLFGTGQLPKFEDDLYKLEAGDLYLIPTAEVPLTGFYASGKAFQESDLPKRLCAYTPCFRSEAGAAGRDTRGLIRQHQFDKIELVHLCKPEDSTHEHEQLVKQAESILEKLELPYRRIELCTGDLGFAAGRCYDLEVWFPSQRAYREISSCSNCCDFQARRLGLKYKTPSGKLEFIHTLNGSGLAVGRTWAAIIENYQLEGANQIRVPKVLRAYLGDRELI
ncbi:MAG: serine--tRNA ligase [Candidatus Caenarcaniphilales bacterium]|nr:serine--tRNA ligase [Candidatus Caenarcaniphilales bacterium]